MMQARCLGSGMLCVPLLIDQGVGITNFHGITGEDILMEWVSPCCDVPVEAEIVEEDLPW